MAEGKRGGEGEGDMDLIGEARRVFRIESDAVRALSDRLGPSFTEAVNAIDGAGGRVVVTGMGKSGLIGKKIAATLASIGVPSLFLHPAEAIHGDLGMVTSEDVVLAISTSGETEEVVALIPYLKRFRVRLISLSGNTSSTLARVSDVSLDVGVKEEACRLGVVPTASTMAALAMGDALAVALLKKRGVNEDDFAFLHPGGSIGKRLLVKVGDLMHTGDAVPRVGEGARMADVVVEMSSKRLGMTVVEDNGGALAGVITDGDLRRGIERFGQGFFEMKAREAMSKNPKSVPAESLAQKALSIMEERSITALVVLGDGGVTDGIIHLHDILRKGIA